MITITFQLFILVEYLDIQRPRLANNLAN